MARSPVGSMVVGLGVERPLTAVAVLAGVVGFALRESTTESANDSRTTSSDD